MRKIYIVDHAFPPTSDDISAAADAGAAEVLCGIPPSLAAMGVETFGYHEIVEPVAPPTVPPRISRMQGRRALKAAGLLAAVEGYFAGLDVDDDARMTYEDASHWERDHPMIAGLAALLNLDSGEVDTLFIDASQIA